MTLDYAEQSNEQLTDLLSYPDMRIRKRAQFQLVKNGSDGFKALKETALKGKNQFARIHAIWGIGQKAAEGLENAQVLTELLSDSDPEIIAQALKVLGDVKFQKAGADYVELLKHNNARVKFFAAQALGRIKFESAVEPLLNMIAENNDADVYLRHAGVLALTRIGKAEPWLLGRKRKQKPAYRGRTGAA